MSIQKRFRYDKGKRKKYAINVFLPPYLIMVFIGCPAVLIYFKETDVLEILNMYLYLSLYVLVFFSLPGFIFWYNHYSFAKDVELVTDGESFTLHSQNEKIVFLKDDIEYIDVFLSPVLYDKRINFVYWGNYSYMTLSLKSGQKLFISCMTLDEPKIFSPLIAKRHKKQFPLLRKKVGLAAGNN
ncbi:hypothetical protein R9C00_04715 [Flammeovirgaceae bacterium SG7u.111]|nr:hypothetical protein [Flammeovirgaceae bacterium SG7u.132]WPO36745.1 hypothetical protein R9C00_04715 [Flammeovirgaceae bacterium SG7u.111]